MGFLQSLKQRFSGEMLSPVPEEDLVKNVSQNEGQKKGFLSGFLGRQESKPEPAPVMPLSLESYGWVKGEDNVYRKPEQIKPQPTPVPGLNVAPESDKYLNEIVFPITRKYGIPDAVAAGQFAGESRGQSKYAQAPYNNPYNINAVDSNPDLAHQYPTPQAGVDAYGKLISTKYKDALKQPTIVDILRYIEQGGYAGDPNTYQQRSSEQGGAGYPSYSQFLMDTPEFKKYNYKQ
jgi:flagellum-specific peptidoglycan hydrolase FlgJ